MEQNEPYQRDTKGDLIIPYAQINKELREKEHVYVFHFKDKQGFYHEGSEENYAKFKLEFPNIELITHHIFKAPKPYDPKLTDAWILNSNKYDYYLGKHFRPIFTSWPIYNNRRLEMEFTELILTQKLFNAIKSFVIEYHLEQHEEFVFYLVAKLEKVYVKEVEYYERPEQKKKIRDFPKEVEKLIHVVKLNKPNYKNEKLYPELVKASFEYTNNSPNTITITDNFLLDSIINAIKNDYIRDTSEDWEGYIEALPYILYSENQLPNAFRHRAIKALHNFFKEVKAFDFSKSKTTDHEMFAIGHLLELANIKYRGRDGVEMEIETHKNEIKQRVRTEFSRNELVYHPTHLTREQVEYDLEKLKKYFDQTLLKFNNGRYNTNKIVQVKNLATQYKVESVLPELAYLSNCLDNFRFTIGHQLDCPFHEDKVEQINDYNILKNLTTHLKNGKHLNQLSYKLTGSEKNQEFTERLPLEIVEQALLEYYKNHESEFQVDLYESKIEGDSNSFSILPNTCKLRQPQDRFLSTFTKQCYQFLKDEAPYKDSDFNPSRRFFGVIGKLLSQAGYISNKEEDFIFQKVKYWFNL